uniref:Uncharacterized protein n=1 Tax=Parascaris univalens TaxID=6257 RepID=A0A915CAV7_PARUN
GIPATRRPVWTSLTDVWRTYCSVSLIHQAPNKRTPSAFRRHSTRLPSAANRMSPSFISFPSKSKQSNLFHFPLQFNYDIMLENQRKNRKGRRK